MYLALKNALGKSFILFSGLLNKFSGASAAYSLRRLGPYNGPAVRIRRASDNVEVNVAFNGAKAVGTDSPITVVSGSTTATTLGAFLSEPIPTFTADFSSGVDGFVSFSGGTLAGNEDGIGGEDNNLSSTQSGTGQVVYGLNSKTTIGKKYKVSFKYYVPSESGSYTQISIRDGASTIIGSDESPTTNNWISVEATAVFTTAQIRFQFVGTSVVGEKIYIRDVVVSEIGEATVHTWYDQSGNSKDAPQDASGEQPKIASTGALLSDGILFDGDNDGLNMPTDLISSINSASAFMVAKAVETDSSRVALALSRNSPDFRFYLPAIVSSNFNFGYGTSATAISLGAANTNEHLFSATAGSSTAEAFLDGASKGTVSSLDGTSPLTSDGIGGINASTHWSGNIKEIIIYASDQSTNRTGIESNIDDYYELSNVGLTGNWTADGNEEAFTADGQDGFTCQVATASVYVGQQLSEKLPSGNFINLSFDLDLQPLGGTPASINLILKKTTNWSSSSNTVSVTTVVPVQGHNSVTLTSNDDDAEYVVFAEGSDNVDFKVSNFKVSKFPLP